MEEKERDWEEQYRLAMANTLSGQVKQAREALLNFGEELKKEFMRTAEIINNLFKKN